MKLFAPAYYKNFKCIAERCRHSCCIGWEIDVDKEALQKYEDAKEAYGDSIRKSISHDGAPHFCLDDKERCPHLDETGLCRIITAFGEGYLCEICREHPRFYHDTSRGREVGLGMACEEACRLILSTEEFSHIEEIGESEGDLRVEAFDPLPERERIYRILSDASLPYPKRLTRLSRTYGVSLSAHTDKEWRELLSSLEYLDDGHRALFSRYSSKKGGKTDTDAPLLRALGYFIYRHVSSAESMEELRCALGFSLFCERLLASMVREGGDVLDCARLLSEEIEYSEENTQAIKDEFWFL